MKFESQICTSREQSERLLKMGLSKVTGDMKHFFDNRNDYSFFHRWKCWPYKWDEESLIDSENIPAWSLHRLIELSGMGIIETTTDNIYDKVIAYISYLIKCESFNKEYLEQ